MKINAIVPEQILNKKQVPKTDEYQEYQIIQNRILLH